MLKLYTNPRPEVRIFFKKQILDASEPNSADQLSPVSPLTPLSIKNKFNSLKSYRNPAIEQFSETPRQSGYATSRSRPKILANRFILKSNANSQEQTDTENNNYPRTNSTSPVNLKRWRPQPPSEGSTPLSQPNSPAIIKRESEFSYSKTPRSPTTVRDRFTFKSSSSEDQSVQPILPKLNEPKKESEFVSPKNRANLPELKYKAEAPLEPKAVTIPKLKLRFEPQAESALEDSQQIRQSNSGRSTPCSKPGRNLYGQAIKEPKADANENTERVVATKPGKKTQQPTKPGSYRHLIFAPQIDKIVFKRHLLMVHNGLIYATQYLRGPTDKFIELRQISLAEPSQPKPSYKKTLLLDLDETLIKSCKGACDHDKIAYAEKDGQVIEVRPYTSQFLKKLKAYYEIIIFTASAKHYAQAIIDCIDPERSISYILDRNYCLETKNGFAIKDLRIIKNRELKNMVIVDNLVHSFGLQLENGIPILEWNGDKEDKELYYLSDYLIEASYVDDIREFNSERLKLKELASSSLPHILLQNWQ